MLLVDDDVNLLNGLRRRFRKQFALTTAAGPEEALSYLAIEPFAVAVVDMQMPGMNGVELLRQIKKQSPLTVSMMLTGNADQTTAIAAINEGAIFRFFNKPCPEAQLAQGINAALAQYRLVTAEHELLEHTLAGSVKVLVDVLAMVDPGSFGRSQRIREWAMTVAKSLEIKQPWRLNMAAMLSQLGNITLAPGEAVADAEKMSASAASTLIRNIPRLAPVADIVALQHARYDGHGAAPQQPTGEDIPLEARILKILIDLERVFPSGSISEETLGKLSNDSGAYDPGLWPRVTESILANALAEGGDELSIAAGALIVNDLLIDDLAAEDGTLILTAGARLSTAHIQKIQTFAKTRRIKEPIRVQRMVA